MLYTCDFLKEPDYLDVKKTEVPEPSDIVVQQINAFTLEINWRITKGKRENVEGFLIERLTSDNSISFNNDTLLNHQLFDSLMKEMKDSAKTGTLQIFLGDTNLVERDTSDFVHYWYRDRTAYFDHWTYYRVTATHGELRAFSVLDTAGVHFFLPPPESLKVEQPNDFELKLSWNLSEYPDIRYQVVRIDSVTGSVEADTVVDSASFTDRSYTTGSICDNNYNVRGLRYNRRYQYGVTSFAAMDSSRRSDPAVTYDTLVLKEPQFDSVRETRPISENSIRLYLKSESVDTLLDTYFVLRKPVDGGIWGCIDTIMRDSLSNLYYNYNRNYLIDDNNLPSGSTGEFSYRIVGKGEVNVISSDPVSESPLDVPGFTFIEGGTFHMGCTGCDIDTTVMVHPFYISVLEVYDTTEFFGETTDDRFPVDNVSWDNARRLSKSLNNKYSYSFYLPTEMQWEYAAHWDIFHDLGSFYPWPSDSEDDISGEYANYKNSGDQWEPGKAPVGAHIGKSYFGLYDMGGNILEWCLDSYDNEDTTWAVLRGGGYFHDPEYLRATKRFGLPKSTAVPGVGFRIVMKDPFR